MTIVALVGLLTPWIVSGDVAASRNAILVPACTPRWSTVPSPRVAEGTLRAVDAVSGTDVWAVGTVVGRRGMFGEIVAASPLIEHWDGRQWSVAASPVSSGVLTDVSAASRRDVWAVGWDPQTGAPLIVHWDGVEWSAVPVPRTVRAATAVAALSPSDVWIVGTGGSDVPDTGEISHWDGRQWTRVLTKRNASFSAIAPVSAQDVWVVGHTVPPKDWDKALMLHWNGTNWQSFVHRASAGSDYAWLGAVGASSRSSVWAGGGEHAAEMSPPAIGPLMLRWDGRRWTRERAAGGETEFWGIAPVSSGEAWAVSGNPWSYELQGDLGYAVWHRVGGRWRSTKLPKGWELSDVVRTGGSRSVLWAVGQAGSAPKGYEGEFPAHTVPLVRRFGC